MLLLESLAPRHKVIHLLITQLILCFPIFLLLQPTSLAMAAGVVPKNALQQHCQHRPHDQTKISLQPLGCI